MQFSTIVNAALFWATALAVPASLEANSVSTDIDTFSIPDAYDASKCATLITRGDCSYFIQTFAGRGFQGKIIEDQKTPMRTATSSTTPTVVHLSLKPVQAHCTHGHLQFYKSDDGKWCSQGTKLGQDLRGATCVSPNLNYESVIISNY